MAQPEPSSPPTEKEMDFQHLKTNASAAVSMVESLNDISNQRIWRKLDMIILPTITVFFLLSFLVILAPLLSKFFFFN
jgi:hypothetical protein